MHCILGTVEAVPSHHASLCIVIGTRVNFITPHQPSPTAIAEATSPLFLWRGAGIVLIGTREAGRLVLARAWVQADCLDSVRRWTFTQPIRFSGQVRRLVTDALGDVPHAREAGLQALNWAESIT